MTLYLLVAGISLGVFLAAVVLLVLRSLIDAAFGDFARTWDL
jgi:hypothetical protein